MANPQYKDFLFEVRNHITSTMRGTGLDLSSSLDLYNLSAALDGVVGSTPALLFLGGSGLEYSIHKMTLILLAASPLVAIIAWTLWASFGDEGFLVVPAFKLDLSSLIVTLLCFVPLVVKGPWAILVAIALCLAFKVAPTEVDVPPIFFKPYLVVMAIVAVLIAMVGWGYQDPKGVIYLGSASPTWALLIVFSPAIVALLWAFFRSIKREGVMVVPAFRVDLQSLLALGLVLTPLALKSFWVIIFLVLFTLAIAKSPAEVEVPPFILQPYAVMSSFIGVLGAVFLAFARSPVGSSFFISCNPLSLLLCIMVATAIFPLWILVYPCPKGGVQIVPPIKATSALLLIVMGSLSPLFFKGLWPMLTLATIVFFFVSVDRLPDLTDNHVLFSGVCIGPWARRLASSGVLLMVLFIILWGVATSPRVSNFIIGDNPFILLFTVVASSLLIFLWALLLLPSKNGFVMTGGLLIPEFKVVLGSKILVLFFLAPILLGGVWAPIVMALLLSALCILPAEFRTFESKLRPAPVFSFLAVILIWMLFNGAAGLVSSDQSLALLRLGGALALVCSLFFMLFITYRAFVVNNDVVEIPSITLEVAPTIVLMIALCAIFFKPLWFLLLLALLSMSLYLLPWFVTLPTLRFDSYILTIVLAVIFPIFFNGVKVAIVGGLLILALKLLALLELSKHTGGSKEVFLKNDLAHLPYEDLNDTGVFLVHTNPGLLFPLGRWSRVVGEFYVSLMRSLASILSGFSRLYQKAWFDKKYKGPRKKLRKILEGPSKTRRYLYLTLKWEAGYSLAWLGLPIKQHPQFKPRNTLVGLSLFKLFRSLGRVLNMLGLSSLALFFAANLQASYQVLKTIWDGRPSPVQSFKQYFQPEAPSFRLRGFLVEPSHKRRHVVNLASDMEVFASRGSSLLVFMFLIWSFFARILLVISLLCLL